MAVFGLPGGSELLIIAFVAVPAILLQLYPLWRICERLGRPGALSLLMFVPLGFLGLIWFLALSEPPADRATV